MPDVVIASSVDIDYGRIPDTLLDHLGDAYRNYCQGNDVLMIKNKVIEFGYWLYLQLAADGMEKEMARWNFRRSCGSDRA